MATLAAMENGMFVVFLMMVAPAKLIRKPLTVALLTMHHMPKPVSVAAFWSLLFLEDYILTWPCYGLSGASVWDPHQSRTRGGSRLECQFSMVKCDILYEPIPCRCFSGLGVVLQDQHSAGEIVFTCMLVIFLWSDLLCSMSIFFEHIIVLLMTFKF